MKIRFVLDGTAFTAANSRQATCKLTADRYYRCLWVFSPKITDLRLREWESRPYFFQATPFMPPVAELFLGEFSRTLDERYRVSLPAELLSPLLGETSEVILAKERPGCLSLWNPQPWRTNLNAGIELVLGKMRAGKLEGRWDEVQRLGRLLSTRHRVIQLANRGRLLIPDSFRPFLGVEPNGEMLVIGAGVCVELWQPSAWTRYVADQMPEFRATLDRLTG